jgi:hypothetical protein
MWMLIPTGIILGNGMIFSYFALTNWWDHWLFMWPLEPLLVVGTVWLTVRLAGRGDRSRRTSRLIARTLGAVGTGWCILLTVAVLTRPWW